MTRGALTTLINARSLVEKDVRHKINDKGSSTELTDPCREVDVVLNLKKNKEIRQKEKKTTAQNKIKSIKRLVTRKHDNYDVSQPSISVSD